MLRYIIVSISGGILFGFLDGIINANSYARKLLEVYKPISKSSINIPLGFAIDIFYGFVMAGLFIILYKSLPGKTGLIKGLSFGLTIWFFRVVMHVFSQGMMFKIPASTLIYLLLAGLVEMLTIGLLFGLTLKSN